MSYFQYFPSHALNSSPRLDTIGLSEIEQWEFILQATKKNKPLPAQSGKLPSFAVEFLRYIVVGGTAFLVDYGILYAAKTYVFRGLGDMGVYIATALGFIAGLVYNYILSLLFVFESAKTGKKGRTAGAFLLFAVIGVIGLLLTEAGMYAGYQLLHIHYMIVKIFVAAVVLIWNYAARKLLIFR